jgi:hypothetical protein
MRNSFTVMLVELEVNLDLPADYDPREFEITGTVSYRDKLQDGDDYDLVTSALAIAQAEAALHVVRDKLSARSYRAVKDDFERMLPVLTERYEEALTEGTKTKPTGKKRMALLLECACEAVPLLSLDLVQAPQGCNLFVCREAAAK